MVRALGKVTIAKEGGRVDWSSQVKDAVMVRISNHSHADLLITIGGQRRRLFGKTADIFVVPSKESFLEYVPGRGNVGSGVLLLTVGDEILGGVYPVRLSSGPELN